MMKSPFDLTKPVSRPDAMRGIRRREAERDAEIAAWIAHQVETPETAPELRLPPPVSR